MAEQQSTQAPLGTVHPFPAIAPGHHLAPLGIGAPGPSQQIVFVSCPDWCVTNHLAEWVHFIDDVDHSGEEFEVHVPSFFNESQPAYTLSAKVGCDPMSSDQRMRDAHIVVGDAASVDAYLTPDKASEVAADLRKLAAVIDEAARTARLHNQAESLAVTA